MGSELSNTHFAIVLNSDDNNEVDNITVIPLTSKKGYKRLYIGNVLKDLSCKVSGGVDERGNCKSYSSAYFYKYNDAGEKDSYRYCYSGNIQGSDSCSAYNGGADYTYGTNNGVNTVTTNLCGEVNNQGVCTRYSEKTERVASNNRSVSSWYCTGWTGTSCGTVIWRTFDPSTNQRTSNTSATCSGYTDGTCNSWSITVTPYVNGTKQTDIVSTCAGADFHLDDASCSNPQPQ